MAGTTEGPPAQTDQQDTHSEHNDSGNDTEYASSDDGRHEDGEGREHQ